jgi:nucleoside diphosphate kinase
LISTLALIRPEAYGHMGKIIDAITKHGLTVGQMKLCKLTSAEATAFTGNEQAGSSLAGKPVVALEVIGKDAQATLSSFSGKQIRCAFIRAVYCVGCRRVLNCDPVCI